MGPTAAPETVPGTDSSEHGDATLERWPATFHDRRSALLPSGHAAEHAQVAVTG